MSCELKSFLPVLSLKGSTVSALVLSVFFAGHALAAKPGHGTVTSAAGEPLQLMIPMLELNPQDQLVLSAKVADARLWVQAGLTPPVDLESLTVTVLPGLSEDSRRLVVSSTKVATRSPVDILLEVTTATGAAQVQSSYLVLLPETFVREGKLQSSDRFKVGRGDTLFSIAQRHAVPGTNIYQMLWALYEANPDAFIGNNMNLLRAGAAIKIPDAQTVRAVDTRTAREMFQKHLSAFNQRRGVNAGRAAPKVETGSTQSGAVTPAAPAPVAGENVDQLRLSAASQEEQNADAKVAVTKEIAELQSRIDALQQNVRQLKEIAGETAVTPADSVNVENSGNSVTPANGPDSNSSTDAKSALERSTNTLVNSTVNTETAVPAPVEIPAIHRSDKSVDQADKSAPAANILERLTSMLAENILAVLTAVLALSALVIAWMLRRAGERRDEESDDLDSQSSMPPALQSDFDKKLNAISLSLDDDEPLADEPVAEQPSSNITKKP
jgi:pilus assembly protein FimV